MYSLQQHASTSILVRDVKKNRKKSVLRTVRMGHDEQALFKRAEKIISPYIELSDSRLIVELAKIGAKKLLEEK